MWGCTLKWNDQTRNKFARKLKVLSNDTFITVSSTNEMVGFSVPRGAKRKDIIEEIIRSISKPIEYNFGYTSEEITQDYFYFDVIKSEENFAKLFISGKGLYIKL